MKFLQREVLFVVPDQYDFKFSVKAAERKHRAEDSTHIQEMITAKFQSQFKVTLGIQTIKPIW